MDDLWVAVRWLHLLAMAFFVGGQLVIAVAVAPVERRGADLQRLRAIARRFGWGTLIAVGMLLVTGAALASHFGRWSDPTLHLKLALVGIAAVLMFWHVLRPRLHVLQALLFALSLVIVWLGLTISHGGG
jgi:uncharacterized membrane protein